MFEILLGHLVGDYLLQNNWMAFNKSKYNNTGWLTCIIHCLLYSLSVCFFMWQWTTIWFIMIFLSHFVLDKFELPEKYLKLIHGRSLERFIKNSENKEYTPYVGLQSGFTSLVYAVVDNTIHLLIIWSMWTFLLR